MTTKSEIGYCDACDREWPSELLTKSSFASNGVGDGTFGPCCTYGSGEECLYRFKTGDWCLEGESAAIHGAALFVTDESHEYTTKVSA